MSSYWLQCYFLSMSRETWTLPNNNYFQHCTMSCSNDRYGKSCGEDEGAASRLDPLLPHSAAPSHQPHRNDITRYHRGHMGWPAHVFYDFILSYRMGCISISSAGQVSDMSPICFLYPGNSSVKWDLMSYLQAMKPPWQPIALLKVPTWMSISFCTPKASATPPPFSPQTNVPWAYIRSIY